ncbi:hypothetical protein FOBRF1_013725 [Fusarium oxysporum]
MQAPDTLVLQIYATTQHITTLTRPAPRCRSASPCGAHRLALLVRDGGLAVSPDGMARADAAFPAAQDASWRAALGAAEQDGPRGAALARVADLDLADGAAQALRCISAGVASGAVIGIRIAALGATRLGGAAASAFNAVAVLSATGTAATTLSL